MNHQLLASFTGSSGPCGERCRFSSSVRDGRGPLRCLPMRLWCSALSLRCVGLDSTANACRQPVIVFEWWGAGVALLVTCAGCSERQRSDFRPSLSTRWRRRRGRDPVGIPCIQTSRPLRSCHCGKGAARCAGGTTRVPAAARLATGVCAALLRTMHSAIAPCNAQQASSCGGSTARPPTTPRQPRASKQRRPCCEDETRTAPAEGTRLLKCPL